MLTPFCFSEALSTDCGVLNECSGRTFVVDDNVTALSSARDCFFSMLNLMASRFSGSNCLTGSNTETPTHALNMILQTRKCRYQESRIARVSLLSNTTNLSGHRHATHPASLTGFVDTHGAEKRQNQSSYV